jgi:hypothetical protein
MRPPRNILGAVAVLWLGLGGLILLTDLPRSVTSGWRNLVGLFFFGPPLLIIFAMVFEFGLVGFFRFVYPRNDSSWHPIFRILWIVVTFLLFVLALIAIPWAIKSMFN